MEHNDHKRVYPEDVTAKEKESLMETLQEAKDASLFWVFMTIEAILNLRILA